MLSHFTIHGHRGCRGHLPENTIPAFLKAIDLGCHFLELDVVITADHQVLVSHEPWLNHEICSLPDGKELNANNEKNFNLYQMDHQQIKSFDCGLKAHPRFPGQKPLAAYKPLLSELIEVADQYTADNGLSPIGFNIEVKRVATEDHLFHPDGQRFTELILDLLQEKKVMDRCIFQTFDLECLQIAEKLAPELTKSLLVDKLKPCAQYFDELGFQTPVFGPWFKFIDESMMEYCNANHIKVIPWTVNEKTDIQKVMDLGVSGIISDYPDRVVDALQDIQ